jgi:hypothetical protein
MSSHLLHVVLKRMCTKILRSVPRSHCFEGCSGCVTESGKRGFKLGVGYGCFAFSERDLHFLTATRDPRAASRIIGLRFEYGTLHVSMHDTIETMCLHPKMSFENMYTKRSPLCMTTSAAMLCTNTSHHHLLSVRRLVDGRLPVVDLEVGRAAGESLRSKLVVCQNHMLAEARTATGGERSYSEHIGCWRGIPHSAAAKSRKP